MNTPQSYGASFVVWDHIVLPATHSSEYSLVVMVHLCYVNNVHCVSKREPDVIDCNFEKD